MLILASASPRRLELLRLAGYDPLVDPADVDETFLPAFTPIDNAALFARNKARVVAARRPGDLVLGADTIVTIDDLLLGKPVDAADARAMLRRLSGRTHSVVTCVSLTAWGSHAAEDFVVTTRVEFRALDEADVENYLATGEWRDKAGGYAVQGHAAGFARSLEGSYTNVVGLPLCEVSEALKLRGFTAAPGRTPARDASDGGGQWR